MRKGWMAGVAAMLMAAAVQANGAGAPAEMLQPGAEAPNFTLPSQTDTPVSLKEYHGKYVVLYFYPKDQTPGCSIEAHNFERDKEKFAALNAVVLGVSLDTVESHKAFCTKDGLNFKLLADPSHKVVDAYGVPITTYNGTPYASRDTFLIGPDGRILHTWQVKNVGSHSDEVLATLAQVEKK